MPQFLLGYVALRYMKNPALAFDHFSRILTRVSTPYAKARAGYWGGRAAEAQGKSELAAKWYAAGGRPHGHLLRAARRPRTRQRCTPAPGARAGSRCRRNSPASITTRWFAPRVFSLSSATETAARPFFFTWPTMPQTPTHIRDARHPCRDQRADRSRNRGSQARDRSRNPADDPWLPGHGDTERRHRGALAYSSP